MRTLTFIELSYYNRAMNTKSTVSKKHKISYVFTRILFYLMLGVAFFTILFYCLPRQNRETFGSDYIDFSQGWVAEDGTPADFSHISGLTIVSKEIPTLSQDRKLYFFYKSTNVSVLIDGRTVYETMQPEGAFFGATPGASYASVPISREDSGSVLTLRINNPYKDGSGKISHMYLGQSADILDSRIRDKAPGFAISFLIASLGVAFILFYLPLRKKRIIGSEMLYLGLFALMVGIFMLTDNRMLQLVLGNGHIYHTIAELSMALITIPLFLYLGKMYAEYSTIMVQGTCLLGAIDFTLCFCLNLLGIKDYHESLTLTHITYGISIAVAIYAIIKGFCRDCHRYLKNNFYHNIGILCLCFAVALDMLLLWFGSAPETSFFTRIGVLMFLIMEAIQVTLRLLRNYQEGVRTQLLSRLAYHDGLTDLLNRTSYMEELKKLDASHNFHVLLALYDVNSLKYVNDTFGHQKGDEIICRVADTLKECLGPLGKCYRIGGDEFVFLSTASDSEKEFLALQKQFEKALGSLVLPDGTEYPVTVAMGYSVLAHNMMHSMDDVVREADEKMYEAKRKMKPGTDTVR